MAVGLKVRPEVSGPSVSRNIPPMKSPIEKKSFQLRLSLGQVIMLWSLLAGLMVAVFLFGLFAGREQGLQTALSGQDVQTVRLPIAMDVAKQEDSLSATFDPAQKTLNPPAAAQPAAPSENSEFDFGAAVEQAKNAAANEAAPSAAAPEVAAEEEEAPTAALEDSEPLTIPQHAAEPEVLKPEVPPAAVAPKVELAAKTPAPTKVPEKAVVKPVEKPKAPEPKKVAEPKVEKPAPTVTNARAGWYVQLAAARTKEEAKSIQLRLAAKSYPAIVQEADVNGATYYRVLVGPYAAKNRAQAEQHKIQGLQLTSGTPFLKFIQ